MLGGVQPTSDIDILVVTGRLATLMKASARGGPDGHLGPVSPTWPGALWRGDRGGAGAGAALALPPSFDLQYGEWLRSRFERGDRLLLRPAVNVDLTTLLTIVLLGDRPLFGPPPGALLDSALMDLGWQPDEWTGLAAEARATADYMISQLRPEAAGRRPDEVVRLAGG